MRIEITRGHEARKTYYQIDRPDLIIGSSTQSHVVIPSTEISRRHLTLQERGGRFFIIDHGSTNGTFLNEERLEAGQKLEWRPYEPLRLATQVMLTLVDDEVGDIEPHMAAGGIQDSGDRTRVIPLAELRAAKNPPSARTRLRPKTRPKKKGMGLTYVLVGGLLYGAFVLQGHLRKRGELKAQEKIARQAREILSRGQGRILCHSEMEKELCRSLPQGPGSSGVVAMEKDVFVAMDEAPCLKQAEKILGKKSSELDEFALALCLSDFLQKLPFFPSGQRQWLVVLQKEKKVRAAALIPSRSLPALKEELGAARVPDLVHTTRKEYSFLAGDQFL